MHRLVKASLLIFLTVCSSLATASVPGNRPDETPWFGSLSGKLLELYRDYYELKKQRDEAIANLETSKAKTIADLTRKRDAAGRVGFPFITDSRSDYEDLMNERRKEYDDEIAGVGSKYNAKISATTQHIVDTLTSPANGSLKEKKSKVQMIQRLSEMYESISAALNTQRIVTELNAKLRLDRSNYGLASQTYQTELELFAILTFINDTFIQRLDNYYRPKIRKRIQENRDQAQVNWKAVNQGVDSNFIDRQNATLTKISADLEKALQDIDRLKEAALLRRRLIEKSAAEIQVIKRVADSAKEASGFVAQINDDFSSIKFDVPELVEFEYLENDLALKGAHSGL